MLETILRGLPRILLLFTIGAANLAASFLPGLAGWTGGAWPTFTAVCFTTGLVFLGLAAGELAVRIAQPRVDAQECARAALVEREPGARIAAAIVYGARNTLLAVFLILMVTASRAQEPPAAARAYLPTLQGEIRAHWPDMPIPSLLGAQVEQETCITLRHRMCWSPRAELRTAREQGVGLGQLTRTWHKDGSPRFDALGEMLASHPRELEGLSWESRLDPTLQLRALVLKDRLLYRQVGQDAASTVDHLAMVLAAYNGGAAGVLSDQRACSATPGCDPGQWFGHVERTSLKARTTVHGYGLSFFCINRAYVFNVLHVRRPRYANALDGGTVHALNRPAAPDAFGCKG